MKAYHWQPDYIVHDYRRDTRFVCYEDWARTLQMLEHELLMESYRKWERVAFIGYQGYMISPDKPKPVLDFAKWKKSFGIKEPHTALTQKGFSKKDEIAKAKANLERIGLGGLLDGSI